MKRTTLALAALLCTALCSTSALATTGFQFVMPAVQAPEDSEVSGMRLVLLYGFTDTVGGFDLGAFSVSRSNNQSGFAVNMGVGLVESSSSGGNFSLINIHQGSDTGVNGAFINLCNSLESGANISFLNITQGRSAIDLGGFSMSEESDVQIGFINMTKEITGIQIGFLNFAENGFFKFFPIFNYPGN